MKTLNQHLITGKLALLIFLVLATNTTKAQSGGKSALNGIMQYKAMLLTPSFTAKIIETDSMKFQILLSNPERERVTVGAYAENGDCLYSKDLFETQYNMYMNFGKMEDGIYYIRVTKGKQDINQKFRISTNTFKEAHVL